MNPQNRKYYAVIVHHGSPDQTKRAVNSVMSHAASPDEVIVVDHAAELLEKSLFEPLSRAKGPVTIIRPARNRGFAAGINIALGALLTRRAQPSDIVVVINNDVVVYPETFTELKKWWQEHPADAIVGVITEEEHGEVAGLGYVDLVTGRAQFHRPSVYAMPYVHGSFFAAPFGVLMTMRGLTEKYFLYWEDAELGARAARQHIPLATGQHIRVKHIRHPNKAKGVNQQYYLVRNGALFLERETPPLWRRAWWLRNRLRLIYHLVRPQGDPLVRQALADACRGVVGQRPVV